MTIRAYVAKHLGAPAVVLDAPARRTTLVHALVEGQPDRLVARLHETTAGRVRLLDPAAPSGVPVRYRSLHDGATTEPVTRVTGAVHALTDSRGRRGVRIVVLDARGSVSTTAQDTPTTTGVGTRWGAEQSPVSLDLDIRALEPEAHARLLHLVQARDRLILLHDPSACPVRGCLEPDVRILSVSSVQSDPIRTADARRARLSLRCTVLPDLIDATAYAWRPSVPMPGAPVLTWGDINPHGTNTMPTVSEDSLLTGFAGEQA